MREGEGGTLVDNDVDAPLCEAEPEGREGDAGVVAIR